MVKWEDVAFFDEPEGEVDYKAEEAREDLRDFFQNPDHWVFEYGSPSECKPEDPYYLNQLSVLFENKYFHWVTHRAIYELVAEGFLKKVVGKFKYGKAFFVRRADVRYYKRRVKELVEVINFYSDPEITRGCGEYAESLFELTLKANGFEIIDRHTNSFGRKRWTETNHNLDLIIERDGIAYGSEIKNTMPYIPRDEFEIKMLEMCDHLGLRPLCICRNAPKSLFPEMTARKGFFWLFKTQIYPPGFYGKTAWIWQKARLPVMVWKGIPDNVQKLFLDWHRQQISK